APGGWGPPARPVPTFPPPPISLLNRRLPNPRVGGARRGGFWSRWPVTTSKPRAGARGLAPRQVGLAGTGTCSTRRPAALAVFDDLIRSRADPGRADPGAAQEGRAPLVAMR